MVLESVIFGVLAALGWGVSDFVAAIVAKRVGVYWTVLGVHVSSVALASVYFVIFINAGSISLLQWGLMLGLGVMALLPYFSVYKAFQIGPVAIVSPVISAYVLVVILLAVIFAGERLNGLQSMGVAASIGGVMLASMNLDKMKSLRELIGRGALIALFGMLGIGIWQYSLGIVSRELGWFLPIYISRLFTLLFLIPLFKFTGAASTKSFTIPLVIAVSVAGIVEMGALFAFARGAEVGIISIVAGASTVYPILPMVGGLFIFRERLSVHQYVGLILAMLGLFILAIST